MSQFKRSAGISLILAVAGILSVYGQPASLPDMDRSTTIDVKHYTIRIKFDRAEKKVFGDTTVILSPKAAPITTVDLDAVGMRFESVLDESDGRSLKYNASPTKLSVDLGRPYTSSETISLRIKYSTIPKSGIFFIPANAQSDTLAHTEQIWTQNEAEDARFWFPSFDFPSDKATSEEFITAKGSETVIGNGQLIETIANTDGTKTWHYKMDIPHSTYLTSFVVGEYAKRNAKYRDVPLGFYTYPGRPEMGKFAFDQTGEMMAVYERVTGIDFPYPKYDQTIVGSFPLGGMENISATTLGDMSLLFGEFEFGRDIAVDLVSHELAHSWFGDLVTCQNWAELWLNEGFASYMEAVYREQRWGSDEYKKKIMSDAKEFLGADVITIDRYGLFNRRADKVADLFEHSEVTYQKGSVVLHMLRQEIGDKSFWDGVRSYLQKYKYSNARSSDLLAEMQASSGRDLKWFFDQWVYSAGTARLNVKPIYSQQLKRLTLTVTQTQKYDDLVPSAFILPLKAKISYGGHEEIVDLKITKRSQIFTYNIPARPTRIIIDPDGKMPIVPSKVMPMK